jgi:hypothetical protein
MIHGDDTRTHSPQRPRYALILESAVREIRCSYLDDLFRNLFFFVYVDYGEAVSIVCPHEIAETAEILVKFGIKGIHLKLSVEFNVGPYRSNIDCRPNLLHGA